VLSARLRTDLFVDLTSAELLDHHIAIDCAWQPRDGGPRFQSALVLIPCSYLFHSGTRPSWPR